MRNRPTDEELRAIPKLYQSENIQTKSKLIYMHFFLGDCCSYNSSMHNNSLCSAEWFVAEYDGKDCFFGFTVLSGDLYNAEWGYFALSELLDINIYGLEVEYNINWITNPAGMIQSIKDWI